MGKERVFWINIHYATFGITSIDNVIADTPPIARWMMGKNLNDIRQFLINKKAVVKEINYGE